MGFASYLEDITDRYYENSPRSDWLSYLGPTPQRRDVEEARFLFGDPLQRSRRLIREFWSYYHQQQPLADIPRGRWEEHFLNLKTLHSILTLVNQVHELHPDAWSVVKDIEARIRTFFNSA